MLEVPEPWDTNQGELIQGVSSHPKRQKWVRGQPSWKVGPSKPFDMRHQVPGFEVYAAGFPLVPRFFSLLPFLTGRL